MHDQLPEAGIISTPPSEVKFFYFKLYLANAASEPVFSWGAGVEQGWGGKAQYGFFDAGKDFQGKRVVEKRGLFFDSLGMKAKETGEVEGGFELRVYRAKGRRRENVQYGPGFDLGGGGVTLVRVGHRKKTEPQRMYTYALMDPLDTPYAVFKYSIMSSEDWDRSSRISREWLLGPLARSPTKAQVDDDEDNEDDFNLPSHDHQKSKSTTSLPQYLQPLIEEEYYGEDEKDIGLASRLSFPPRIRLHPSTSQREPSSPLKRISESDETRTAFFEAGLADSPRPFTNSPRSFTPSDMNKTLPPSPIDELEEEEEEEEDDKEEEKKRRQSKPMGKKRVGSGGMFRSVIASALRRRREEAKRSASR